jgi:hypothetical protein
MRRSLLAATTVAIALAAGPSTPANANLLLEYSVDGGATFTPICSAASGTSCNVATFTTSNGLDFVTVGTTGNSPGTAAGSDLLTATVQLTNPTGANESVELLAGDVGYTMPVAPPASQFLNSIAGTVVIGGAANAFTSQACLDQGDGQNVCPGSFTTPLITASITAPGAGENSNFAGLASLTAPYSMTELLTITLSPGSNINFTASSTVEGVPVNEPTSLALLGAGLVGTGFVATRRRRRTPRFAM